MVHVYRYLSAVYTVHTNWTTPIQFQFRAVSEGGDTGLGMWGKYDLTTDGNFTIGEYFEFCFFADKVKLRLHKGMGVRISA